MDTDPGEEFIKDFLLNDKREIHWRMVFEKKMEGWMGIRSFYMKEVGCLQLGEGGVNKVWVFY